MWWGVYYPQCQRAADSCCSPRSGGMTEGEEERGRLRECRTNGEREGKRVVSCKTLEERPLLSPWICSWTKKAVKYVFHSSLVLCHNKRRKEYCLRKVHCSQNGGVSADDLKYCSTALFYSPFNISDHKRKRRVEDGGGVKQKGQGSPL